MIGHQIDPFRFAIFKVIFSLFATDCPFNQSLLTSRRLIIGQVPAERRCLRLRQADERLLKKSTVYNLTNGRHWEAIAQKAFIIQIYEHRRIGCFSGSLAVVVYQKSNRRALIVPRMSTDGALKKAAQYVHQQRTIVLAWSLAVNTLSWIPQWFRLDNGFNYFSIRASLSRTSNSDKELLIKTLDKFCTENIVEHSGNFVVAEADSKFYNQLIIHLICG